METSAAMRRRPSHVPRTSLWLKLERNHPVGTGLADVELTGVAECEAYRVR